MARILLVAAGLLSGAAGLFALLDPLPARLAAGLLAGWAFLILGALMALAALPLPGRGGSLWALPLGLVSALVGIQILGHPLGGMTALSHVLGVLFLVSGAVKLAAARVRGAGRGRLPLALAGAVTLLLAAAMLGALPVRAVRIFDALFGLELVANAAAALALALPRAEGGDRGGAA